MRHLRIETLRVAIENDIHTTPTSGGDDTMLGPKVYSYDGHGSRIRYSIICWRDWKCESRILSHSLSSPPHTLSLLFSLFFPTRERERKISLEPSCRPLTRPASLARSYLQRYSTKDRQIASGNFSAQTTITNERNAHHHHLIRQRHRGLLVIEDNDDNVVSHAPQSHHLHQLLTLGNRNVQLHWH